MICLRNCQIKVSAKLLHISVIMRMNDSGICLIGNRISGHDQISGIDHIFIKNRMGDKSSQFFIQISSVGSADVGTEEGFDSKYRKIFFAFYPSCLWIIKFPRISFCNLAVFCRKLPTISSSCFRVFKSLYKIFNYIFICRNCILRKIYQNIAGTHVCSLGPGSSMVKFLSSEPIFSS